MKLKIKFIESELDVPIVTFSLNNLVLYNAIIDSGAEQTVFDTEFVKLHQKHFTTQEIGKFNIAGIAASEKKDSLSVGTARLYFWNNDTCEPVDLTLTGLLMSLTHLSEYSGGLKISAVIGADFLKLLKAKIDFKKKELTMTYDLPC